MPTCTPAFSTATVRGASAKPFSARPISTAPWTALESSSKGDAVAALVIVALNLVGGVVVGAAYHGMCPLDALNTFALLSIGNALVTTLPAFLISTAMGMMVTRVASEGALGADLAAQLFARPDALRSAGGCCSSSRSSPRLPRPLFIALGVSAFAAAHGAQRRRFRNDAETRGARERAKRNSRCGVPSSR